MPDPGATPPPDSAPRCAKSARRRPLLAITTLIACALASASAHAGPTRYPLWPNEVRQAADALRSGSDAPEAARAAAMRRMSEYPDALVVDLILLGLADESFEVRREAMRACVDRNLRACLPAAQEAWMNTDDVALRVRALDLFAAYPGEGRLELLVAALVDDDASMRDRAATALARTELDAETDAKVRTLLSSKLDDVIAATRRRAADALGLMGPGPGAVALIRRLDDPDPSVRQSAAEALGRLEDPRAVAPLLRALERDPDRGLARTGIAALARLPGEAVDTALLGFFDRPPHDRRAPVVEAIGLRAVPGATLVEGLIARLRDPGVHDDALRALRLMGPAAAPHLERALARGMEPSLADELERVLAPHRMPAPDNDKAQAVAAPARAPEPAPLDRLDPLAAELFANAEAAREALRNADDRLAVAEALGRAAPDWLAGALSERFARDPAQLESRAWLWALMSAPRGSLAWSDAAGAQAVARLSQWAHAASTDAAQACLAAQALGSAALLADDARADLAVAELSSLATSSRASARACAAMGLARAGRLVPLEALLADASASVRAHAALAAVAMPSSSRVANRKALLARLAWVAARDTHVGPRTCAAYALAQIENQIENQREAASSGARRGSGEARPAGATSWRSFRAPRGAAWVEFDVEGARVVAPVSGQSDHKWVWVAGERPARLPMEQARSPQTQFNELQRWSF